MQHTIKKPTFFYGKGLHEGKKNLAGIFPAPANTGFVFYDNNIEIPATYTNVMYKRACTNLGINKKHYVRTVEHIITALYAAKIENAYITVDKNEVPFLDGSSFQFYEQIKNVGRTLVSKAPFKKLKINRTIEHKDGDKYIRITPKDHFSIHLKINLLGAGVQEYKSETVSDDILECIKARSFGEMHMIMLGKIFTRFFPVPCVQGMRFDNIILTTKNKSWVKGGLKYKDEHIRHKVVDLIGDITLCGTNYILGHIETFNTSHAMNAKVLEKIFSDKKNFEWIY